MKIIASNPEPTMDVEPMQSRLMLVLDARPVLDDVFNFQEDCTVQKAVQLEVGAPTDNPNGGCVPLTGNPNGGSVPLNGNPNGGSVPLTGNPNGGGVPTMDSGGDVLPTDNPNSGGVPLTGAIHDDDDPDGQASLIQGALPSEADLICALRRHACWVCGATATSHDANIGHMLTHLAGTPSAEAPAVAPPSPLAAPAWGSTLMPESGPWPPANRSMGPVWPPDNQAVAEHARCLPGVESEPPPPSSLSLTPPRLAATPPKASPPPSRPPSASPETQLSTASGSPLLDENANVDVKRRPCASLPPTTAGDGDASSLVCAICLKRCADREALLQHVADEVRSLETRARRGRKAKKSKNPAAERFACSQCAASFQLRLQLRRHVVAVHSSARKDVKKAVVDDRPHHCGQCPKRFRRRAHLMQHRLIHTGEKPFRCARCGADFRRKDRLVEHAKKHLVEQAPASNPAPASTTVRTSGTPPTKRTLVPVRTPVAKRTRNSSRAAVTKGTAASVQTSATKRTADSAQNSATKRTAASAQTSATKRTAASVQTSATKRTAASVQTSATKRTAASVQTSATKRTRCAIPDVTIKVEPMDENNEVQAESPVLVKRGRGRPRKYPKIELSPKAETTPASKPSKTETSTPKHATKQSKSLAKPGEAAPQAACKLEELHCMSCLAKYATKGKLRQHVLKVHSGLVPHVCLTCGRANASHKQLLAHVARHIEERVRRPFGRNTEADKQDKTPKEPPSTETESIKSSLRNAKGKVDGPSAPKTPSLVRVDGKVPPRIVLRVVSKNGSKDMNNIATHLLPKLAADLANRAGLTSAGGGSKYVYMLVNKREQGADAQQPMTPSSKVIFRILPKSPDAKASTKIGFRVISRVVPLHPGKNEANALRKIVAPNAASNLRKCTADSVPPKQPPIDAALTSKPLDLDNAKESVELQAMPRRNSAAEVAAKVTPKASPKSHSKTTSKVTPKSTPKVTTKDASEENPEETPELPQLKSSVPWKVMRTPPVSPFGGCVTGKSPLRSPPSVGMKPKPAVLLDTRFPCVKCGLLLADEAKYQAHMRSHGINLNLKKLYQCQCCDKKFHDKSALRLHLQTHL